MGSRGAGSSNAGPKGGGNGGNDIISTSSLISQRERYQAEVDRVLEVMRDVEREYGAIVEDLKIAEMKKGSLTLAYYDGAGNVRVNSRVFNNALGADTVYDDNVRSGYHPSRGDKTGLQAIVAHEMGHRLNYIAGGSKWENLDKTATNIVQRRAQNAGYGRQTAKFRARISGYGKVNNAEAVAEAFSDVYCNGNRASAESKTIVTELNRYFRRNS